MDNWFHGSGYFLPAHSTIRSKTVGKGFAKEVFVFFSSKAHLSQFSNMTKFLTAASFSTPETEKVYFVHPGTATATVNSQGMGVLTVHQPYINYIKKRESEEHFLGFAGDHSAHAGTVREIETARCVQYIGEYGNKWTSSEKANWFPNFGDALSLLKTIGSFCGVENVKNQTEEGKKTILIYNRNQSRKLLNTHKLQKFLNDSLDSEKYELKLVVHSESIRPCELVQLFSKVAALLTPHGFQEILILFMKPGSVVFEIFPPGYTRSMYKNLAASYGVRYGSAISASCKENWAVTEMLKLASLLGLKGAMYRHIARSQDVQISDQDIKSFVELIDLQ